MAIVTSLSLKNNTNKAVTVKIDWERGGSSVDTSVRIPANQTYEVFNQVSPSVTKQGLLMWEPD